MRSFSVTETCANRASVFLIPPVRIVDASAREIPKFSVRSQKFGKSIYPRGGGNGGPHRNRERERERAISLLSHYPRLPELLSCFEISAALERAAATDAFSAGSARCARLFPLLRTVYGFSKNASRTGANNGTLEALGFPESHSDGGRKNDKTWGKCFFTRYIIHCMLYIYLVSRSSSSPSVLHFFTEKNHTAGPANYRNYKYTLKKQVIKFHILKIEV